MSINNRFYPPHPVGEQIPYGLDFAAILPPGVTVQSGSINVQYNTVPPTTALDMTIVPLPPVGRRMYATVTGGTAGRDYRITWNAQDSLGNTWIRSTLLLCAPTS